MSCTVLSEGPTQTLRYNIHAAVMFTGHQAHIYSNTCIEKHITHVHRCRDSWAPLVWHTVTHRLTLTLLLGDL